MPEWIPAANSLNAGIRSIFRSAKYSDLTLRCGGFGWQVHRSIVCPQSPFFAAACDGVFKEATTRTILLEDDDPATIDRMLHFLYTREYDDQSMKGEFWESVHTDGSPETLTTDGEVSTPLELKSSPSSSAGAESLPAEIPDTPPRAANASPPPPASDPPSTELTRAINNIAVYALADKYDIRDLLAYALAKCHAQKWHRYPLSHLRVVATSVYLRTHSGDRGLRPLIARACGDHASAILRDPHWCALLRRDADLGADALREVTKRAEGFAIEAVEALAHSRRLVDELRREKADVERRLGELEGRVGKEAEGRGGREPEGGRRRGR